MKNKTNNNNNNFVLAQRILRHLGRMLSAHIGKCAHTHTHTHEDIPKYRYIYYIHIYNICYMHIWIYISKEPCEIEYSAAQCNRQLAQSAIENNIQLWLYPTAYA